MTTYFTTRADATHHLVTTALAEHADYYDVDGLTDAITRYVPGKGFTQTVTTADFWNLVPDHELRLDVDWVAGDGSDEYNAAWTVSTRAGGTIDSGAFTATDEEDGSFANLDAALKAEGYRREDMLNVEGDWSQFVAARIS